jgi:hypothetical protein
MTLSCKAEIGLSSGPCGPFELTICMAANLFIGSGDWMREIAAHALNSGWTFEVVGRSGTNETDTILSPFLESALASLSEDDRKRFRGYVSVFERAGDSPDQALARAKLGHFLSVAMAN